VFYVLAFYSAFQLFMLLDLPMSIFFDKFAFDYDYFMIFNGMLIDMWQFRKPPDSSSASL